MPSFSRPLRLDTWELMDRKFLDPQEGLFSRSFRIEDGAIVFCDADRKSSRIGHLVLAVNWSNKKGPSGIVIVSHPNWHMPRFIVLAGIPDKNGGFRWLFFCPMSRKLVQVLLFDKESQLFVARSALGRPRRKSDVQRTLQCLGQKLQLQEKFGDLSAKPAGMSDKNFHLLKEGLEHLDLLFKLAATGVAKPIFRHDGSFDILAMATSPIRKPGKIHYRDKTGALRLTARSKKRLGIHP